MTLNMKNLTRDPSIGGINQVTQLLEGPRGGAKELM